jgi:outer membrane biosynthesis protein TonB
MSGLFVLLFLVSAIAFIISMIKPSIFSKINISSRKTAAISLGGLAVFFFMLTVITAPNNQQSVEGLATQSVTVAITNKPTQKPIPSPTPTVVPTVTPAPVPPTDVQPSSTQSISTQPSPQVSSGLSNNNYYTNVDGNQVHSPADSTNGQVPAGATAQCNDGTYSFSQHHSGTCSGHGGVANWL